MFTKRNGESVHLKNKKTIFAPISVGKLIKHRFGLDMPLFRIE